FSFVIAPKVGTLTITIVETNNSTNNEWPFLVHQSQIGLYNATGTAIVASGTDLGNGKATITANATTVGQQFIVCVKYNSKSIVGGPVPTPAIVQYTFTTWVNAINEASASVQLAPTGTPIFGPVSFTAPMSSAGSVLTVTPGGANESHDPPDPSGGK